MTLTQRNLLKVFMPIVIVILLYPVFRHIEFKGLIHSVNFNMDIDGAVLLTPIDEAPHINDPNYFEIGGFGARFFEHKDTGLMIAYGGYPDVLDDYKLTDISVKSGPYTIYDIGIGSDKSIISDIMTSNGFEERISSNNYIYKKSKVVIAFKIDATSRVKSFYIEVESTNKDDVVF